MGWKRHHKILFRIALALGHKLNKQCASRNKAEASVTKYGICKPTQNANFEFKTFDISLDTYSDLLLSRSLVHYTSVVLKRFVFSQKSLLKFKDHACHSLFIQSL